MRFVNNLENLERKGDQVVTVISTVGAKDAATAPIVRAANDTSQPATINPSLLMTPIPIPRVDDPSLFDLPEDAQESVWMAKKGTLEYFRSTFKMGNISSLISSWYQLEKVLDFPKQVKFYFYCSLKNILMLGRPWKDFQWTTAQKRLPYSSSMATTTHETMALVFPLSALRFRCGGTTSAKSKTLASVALLASTRWLSWCHGGARCFETGQILNTAISLHLLNKSILLYSPLSGISIALVQNVPIQKNPHPPGNDWGSDRRIARSLVPRSHHSCARHPCHPLCVSCPSVFKSYFNNFFFADLLLTSSRIYPFKDLCIHPEVYSIHWDDESCTCSA